VRDGTCTVPFLPVIQYFRHIEKKHRKDTEKKQHPPPSHLHPAKPCSSKLEAIHASQIIILKLLHVNKEVNLNQHRRALLPAIESIIMSDDSKRHYQRAFPSDNNHRNQNQRGYRRVNSGNDANSRNARPNWNQRQPAATSSAHRGGTGGIGQEGNRRKDTSSYYQPPRHHGEETSVNNGGPAWGGRGDRDQPQHHSWNQQGAGGWNSQSRHDGLNSQSRHDGNGQTENYQGQTNNWIPQGRRDGQPSQETPFSVQNTKKEPEDDELTQRSKRHKELMSIKNWDDRREAFRQLDKEHKKTLFMWHQDGMTELPPLYVPGDWDDRERRAVQDTINHIRDPEVAASHLGVSVEKPNSDSDSEDSYANMNGVKPMQEYEDFIRALPLCIPMTIGFHAVFLHGDNAWCYCPCGRHMKNWKAFCCLEQFGCNFDRRKEPFEFLKHVDDVSNSCPVHYILHHYLKTVFRNYYGGDRKHLAFENKGSKEFKSTEKFLLKREYKCVSILS
jgi:hypothetical protein